MKNNRLLYVVAAVVVALTLIVSGYSMLTRSASATVVAENSALFRPVPVVLYSGTFVTSALQYGPQVDVINFDASELQYVIDQTPAVSPTLPNTLTVTLQYSNDRTNWTEEALVTDNAADASGWLSPTVTGRYWRMKITPTGELTTTISVISVLK